MKQIADLKKENAALRQLMLQQNKQWTECIQTLLDNPSDQWKTVMGEKLEQIKATIAKQQLGIVRVTL